MLSCFIRFLTKPQYATPSYIVYVVFCKLEFGYIVRGKFIKKLRSTARLSETVHLSSDKDYSIGTIAVLSVVNSNFNC